MTQKSLEMVRVFCAVDLSAEARKKAAEHITSLRQQVPESHAKWERPEKLHLTLKFLGDISTADVVLLTRAAQTTAVSIKPFELALDGTGFFPPRNLARARVLWLGVLDPTGSLGQLQAALETACADQGFAREERPFSPHLTLARLRGEKSDQMLARAHQSTPFAKITFSVSELMVMKSELLPTGSRYTPLARCLLGPQSPKA